MTALAVFAAIQFINNASIQKQRKEGEVCLANILFWNTNRKEQIDNILVDIILENKCDIVILAEYPKETVSICNVLSLHNQKFYSLFIHCKRIKIMAKDRYLQEIVFDGNYYTIQNIKSASCEFMLAGVHLPSKMYANGDDNGITISKMLKDIADATQRTNHDKYFIIGDLNANPFENLCISADKLHALPSKNICIKRRQRIVQEQPFSMHYNPMWNLFGDFTNPPGTYFYSGSGSTSYFWNIFDQVILSLSVINSFRNDSLKIITNTKNKSLLNENSIPNKKEISDHLPIVFSFEEEKLV